MEGRMKKYSQVSPERSKVWTEKSPKYHYNHNYNQQQQQQQQQQQNNQKVPVVYYLCRNRQLEHPHFMEVPLSSPDGLYLRDVIHRLNVLRGRGMASMYSWSCKRSYKNGFVWHDLCNDDLILPAHGNEYVLKGSELFEDSNSGNFSPAETVTLHNQKALPEPPSSRSNDESSSSSSLNGRNTKTSQDDDESSPSDQRPCSSPPVDKNPSWNNSLSLTEYKVYKNDGLSDASTQTDENAPQTAKTRDTCTSTDDNINAHPNQSAPSPPPSTSSASSSSGPTETLESLIRADAKKLNSFRILEEEEFRMPNAKLKASNMIMQLISCGSITVKDHSFGLVPTYKPRFSHSRFPAPLFSSSLMLGEIDCLAEDPRLMRGMKLEDKEYFSGSLVETSMVKEGVPNLKRSSSFNADHKSTKKFDSIGDKERGSSTRTKCIPRSIKASISKQPRCESMRSSPLSEGPRISSDRAESSRMTTPGTSNGGSKRMTEPLPGRNVIKIEES
ncbi:protein upstream of flc [Phtheirospermum japonicum]|uniref:Protein upstream of flc n=1 Tax=Phtheirospermum japonicum TaxID=374723 RepID=A0A830DE88_9LAMI|nr:protein upstream of flc [Phtheirospermum japonicum]